jgi:hypothetical protein
MNDMNEQEQLKRMLEEATASDRARNEEHRSLEQVGPEAAGLRDAWLAFGRLLEAADAAGTMPSIKLPNEEYTASPQLRDKVEALSQSTKEHFADHERSVRRIRRWVAVAAVAAAACLILVEVGNLAVNWWLIRAGQQIDRGQPVIGQNRPPQVAPLNMPVPNVPVPKVPVPNMPAPVVANSDTTKQKQDAAAKSSSWDDPLDTQIAAVSQQIDTVRQNWQHRTDDVDLVQYRIDEVSAGLSSGEL